MSAHRPPATKTPGPKAQRTDRGRIDFLRRQLWQSEFIRWPALAESFRRELREFGIAT